MSPPKNTEQPYYWTGCFQSRGGIILLLIGLLWLARDMGWLPSSVGLWPVIFIMIGVWWIVGNMSGRFCR